MMKVCYSELDGPEGLSCRLEAAGHAGFAPVSYTHLTLPTIA